MCVAIPCSGFVTTSMRSSALRAWISIWAGRCPAGARGHGYRWHGALAILHPWGHRWSRLVPAGRAVPACGFGQGGHRRRSDRTVRASLDRAHPLAVLLIPSLGTAGHAVAQSLGPLPTVGEIVRDGDDCDSGVPGFHVRVTDLPDVDPSAGNGSLEYWFIATYDGGQTPRFRAAPSTQSRRSRRTPATSACRSPCQAPPPEGPAGGSRPSSSR